MQISDTPEEVCFGRFRFDLRQHRLLHDGDPVEELGGRALDVLRLLALANGAVVSKDELMAQLWPGGAVAENNLHVHISALRKALGKRDGSDSYVMTVPGRGYRLMHLGVPQAAASNGRATAQHPVLTVLPSSKLTPDPEGFFSDVNASDKLRPRLQVRRPIIWLSSTALMLLATATAIWGLTFHWLPGGSSAPRLSIVVLPFANLAGDPAQQYFADGITEDLTTDLSRLADMLVISRDTAFTYKSEPVSAKRILLRAQHHCEAAIPEYEAVLAANRNVLAAIGNIGRCKIYLGQLNEGVALEEQAIRLSPHDPFLGVWYFRIGQAKVLQSRIDEAIGWLEKANDKNPAYPFVHAWLAAAYGLKGDLPRAAAELADARRLSRNGSPTSISAARAIAARDFASGPQTLLKTTFLAGLRQAGVPEE